MDRGKKKRRIRKGRSRCLYLTPKSEKHGHYSSQLFYLSLFGTYLHLAPSRNISPFTAVMSDVTAMELSLCPDHV